MHIKNIIVLLILSYLFFLFGNSLLYLTNPDEVFYSLTAKEMAQKNEWFVPVMFGQPQFEKPILIYWAIRISFMIFGISDYSARFFSSVFGIIGVLALYITAFLGYKDKKKAFICALILMSAGIYIGMARIILTDVIFTVFILLALMSFYWAYENIAKKTAGIILFYIFSAFAVLTKGPLGLAIPLLTIVLFLLIKRQLRFIFNKASFAGLILFLAISLPWYIYVTAKYGNMFIQEFFYNDHIRRLLEAEHRRNDTWYFYPVLMIAGMMPWSIFSLAAAIKTVKEALTRKLDGINLFAASWIIVTFCIFEPAHSKLVSYILPLYPALAILTGNYIYSAVISGRTRMFSFLSYVTSILFLAVPVLMLLCPDEYKIYLPEGIKLYGYAAVFTASAGFLIYFTIKRKPFAVAYNILFQMLLLLFFVPLTSNNLNPHLSSKDACRLLKENYNVTGKIICNKPFARGVNYYTGNDVVIWGGGFFSPHPIDHLGSDEETIEFIKNQGETFCVLSKSSYKDLVSISDHFLNVDLLKVSGEQFVARVLPHKDL